MTPYTLGSGLTQSARPEPYRRSTDDPVHRVLRVYTQDPGTSRSDGAVAEIVDNACRRAYPNAQGFVHVSARREGCDLFVTVEDDGVGFDVSRLDEELLATPLHSGLSRAISLCEDLHVESEPGAGTRVDMRFTATFLAFDGGRGLDLADHDFLMPDAARVLSGPGEIACTRIPCGPSSAAR